MTTKQHIIRKDATIEPAGSDDEFPGQFRVILSAPTEDRDGDTLLPNEWKMPLPEHITFDQDHGMDVASTVGSGTPTIDEKTGQLIVEGTYSSLQRAQDVRTLVNEGHIRTTSVAFMTVPDTTKAAKKGAQVRELLNGAFVAVPSNREALVLESKGFMKAGARNAAADAQRIQEIHDLTLELGASPTPADAGESDDEKSLARKAIVRRVYGRKAVVGSLEATQQRVGDAVQDAYPGAWTWVRATIPDEGGATGTVVYAVEDTTTYDMELYKQTYADDGQVVSLTGTRSAVDVMEVITPDPDEAEQDSKSAGAADDPAGAKAPAGSSAAPALEEQAEISVRATMAHISAMKALASTPTNPEGNTP